MGKMILVSTMMFGVLGAVGLSQAIALDSDPGSNVVWSGTYEICVTGLDVKDGFSNWQTILQEDIADLQEMFPNCSISSSYTASPNFVDEWDQNTLEFCMSVTITISCD